MAEWSNAAVLKTVDRQLSGGSNPSLCATAKGTLSGCPLPWRRLREKHEFPLQFAQARKAAARGGDFLKGFATV